MATHTGPDMLALENFLEDWRKRVSASIGQRIVELQGCDDPCREVDLVEQIRVWNKYHERLEDQLLALRRARMGDPAELFAGAWPPIDPLSLAAQRNALLHDMDELPEAYLGEKQAAEDSVMFGAWKEADEALRKLDPKDPDVASAILQAARHDEAHAGGTWDWVESLMGMAEAHAGPPPPRPA